MRAPAPLPRAYQWVDGSAYVNHVELVRRARGAAMPPEFWTDPLMYQGASDRMLGPCEDIVHADEAWGIDFEAEVAVITGDGDVLMALGSLATIAAKQPKNLSIVCIDNAVYAATGMQPTATGAGCDLAATARACGFTHKKRPS